VPTLVRPSTGGRKALALLEQLGGLSPSATAQLRTGEVIAEGGMGVIHEAEQVALGRTVAVKTLKPGRKDPSAALELLREAWVTGKVEHPNVVPVHYLGLDDQGNPLIVLKRIEGVEWHQLIEDAEQVRERFGATDLLAWNLGVLMQVLNALRFAHSRGIVHRDLKPSNVMIGEFGEVYLLDWGIAVSLRDDGSGRLPLAADQDEMAGTPCYMAPEMLGRKDCPPLSERTDVYLAGAVLFDIVAGRPPHEGETAVAVVTSVLTSTPELPAEAPGELARICARAMQRAPEDRYESVEALRLDLQAYLEHRGSARLADLAGERLDQLLATLASPACEREQVYRLFGACRFGFHEALVAWRGNEEARRGLLRATCAVAEYELADDPRAAVALLTELEEPPAELLAKARAAAAAAADRYQQLEALRADHDDRTGTRTRTFLTIVLGVMFTIFPLIAAVQPEWIAMRHHGHLLGWSVGFLVVVTLLGLWARESMSKTVVNRRTWATAMFLFVGQAAMVLGTWRLGLTVVQTEVLMMYLWIAISGMVAIGIDRRLAPSTVGYVAAASFASYWPECRFYAMAVANALFTINAVYYWRPETFRWTEEERKKYSRRRLRS
jgi:serine/threonine-protein kinase